MHLEAFTGNSNIKCAEHRCTSTKANAASCHQRGFGIEINTRDEFPAEFGERFLNLTFAAPFLIDVVEIGTHRKIRSFAIQHDASNNVVLFKLIECIEDFHQHTLCKAVSGWIVI